MGIMTLTVMVYNTVCGSKKLKYGASRVLSKLAMKNIKIMFTTATKYGINRVFYLANLVA